MSTFSIKGGVKLKGEVIPQGAKNEALQVICACLLTDKEIIIDNIATQTINAALKDKRRICAVGTTVMRSVESSVSSNGTLNEYSGWTNKFIFPPYDFSIANSMITNFHTPKSTLLMMVSAFADPDFIKEAYKIAIKEKYNFYSYGDAMLII